MTRGAISVVWDSRQGRVRLVPRSVAKFDNQFVNDLLAMRRAGKLKAVWIDEERIRVRRLDQHDLEDPIRLSLKHAHEMIEEWKRSSTFVRSTPKSELALERRKAKLGR